MKPSQLEDTGNLIDELAQKYLGQGYPAEPEGTIRLIARLTPTKVIEKQS